MIKYDEVQQSENCTHVFILLIFRSRCCQNQHPAGVCDCGSGGGVRCHCRLYCTLQKEKEGQNQANVRMSVATLLALLGSAEIHTKLKLLANIG